MGFFDFLFGKQKDKNTTKQEEKKPQTQSATHSMEPFVFESNQHQRFEDTNPVQGLQQCPRTVKVEKNIYGCTGYQLKEGDGYIVRIINGDTGQPQMSAKPMRVIKSTSTEIELKGYVVSAQTPFGFQDVDMSDYGLTVCLQDGHVTKCTLHMYDRNVDIEYRKIATTSNNSSNTARATTTGKEITEAENFVNQAIKQLTAGNDGDAVYHPLYKAWRSLQNNPNQLNNIINEGDFGKGMMAFLTYNTITDIDDQQQIASIAYLFISLAIQKSPNDVNLILNRLLVMLNNREAFQYTISSAIDGNDDIAFMNMSAFEARDTLYKMEYADLAKDSRLQSIEIFNRAYHDLSYKIDSGFFGQNKSQASIIADGNLSHKKVMQYLVNKVLKEHDIDF